MEITEENSGKIWKLWKKDKLNNEKIWKMQKKIVKWYEIYGRKVGWIVKWYGKYGRKEGKYMKNPEENSEKIGKIQRKLWKDMENMEERTISQLALCRGHGILIIPKWPSSTFWPLLWSSKIIIFNNLYKNISNM